MEFSNEYFILLLTTLLGCCVAILVKVLTTRTNKKKNALETIGEPLLDEQKMRYTLLPVQHEDVWAMYNKHKLCYWVPEHVDLAKDLDGWKSLSDDEQYFMKHVLAFFAASDGIVNENLVDRFSGEVQMAEARAFYTIQMAIETIHSEMYGRLLETYIAEESERDYLFQALTEVDSIKRKGEWAFKWINSTEATFAERLVAFAVVEGVFFSGSFASIFWLKQRRVPMPGLFTSNSYIARDEGLHTDFACLLFRDHLVNKPSEERVHEIVTEAVDIECEFFSSAFSCDMIGMNCDMMCDYVRFVADRLMNSLGFEEIYSVENPFEFMDSLNVDQQTNFFEGRVTEYKM